MRRLIETAVTEQQVASVAGYVDTTTLHNHIGIGNRSEIANRALQSEDTAAQSVYRRVGLSSSFDPQNVA